MRKDHKQSKRMNEAFKYYKSKTKAPDLSAVIDCAEKDEDRVRSENSNLSDFLSSSIFQLIKFDVLRETPKIGLVPSSQWEVFKFKEKPGLILIKNPFTSVGQRYWIRRLLKDYTKHPHPNNLLPSRFNENVISNFWEGLNDKSDEQQRQLIKKSMRWSTLGYHYNWTKKVYDENFKNEFPQELHRLVECIADALEFKFYKSEAAIINFYPIGSTLSAHTDHSEFFLESPLFSISFGQSAIFLIGGPDRQDAALPIILNSGDILVMSKESRLCYHAVPRVFQTNRKPWNLSDDVTRCGELQEGDINECLNNDKWKPFENYILDSRINCNVRQVNK